MRIVGVLTLLVLVVLSLRGVRAAYVLFIAMGVAYFPVRAGFELHPRACRFALTADLLVMSLQNYGHVVLFALFFVMSWVQFSHAKRPRPRARALAAVATIMMGAVVEIAQGVTGKGTCRLRDLIPDAIGILFGVGVVSLWMRLRPVLQRRNESARITHVDIREETSRSE